MKADAKFWHGRGAGQGASVRPTASLPLAGTNSGETTVSANADSRPAAVYAALDLGTNNCRLLLAKPAAEGFTVVGSFSRPTRLGEGLVASGRLSDAAVDRTLRALAECRVRLRRTGARRQRAVATEACRRAVNGISFLERARRETGWDLEVLTPDAEARLMLAGCAPLLDRRGGHALVFDIGGGSTELVVVRTESASTVTADDAVEAVASLPLGVVTLCESHGAALRTPEGFAAAVAEAGRHLRAFDPEGRLARLAATGAMQLLGTSGTVTTIAGVHLGLRRYDRRAVDGVEIDMEAAVAASRCLSDASHELRAAHPCVGADRADLTLAGCAVFQAIASLLPVRRLRVADRGLREGMVLTMMREDRPTQ